MREPLLGFLAMIASFLATVLFLGGLAVLLWAVFNVPGPLDPWQRIELLFAAGSLALIICAGITDHKILDERWHALLVGLIWIGITAYSIGVDPLGPVMGPVASLF